MHIVGRIDKEIYKCITNDIVTDEVVITDNQIQHIKDRHSNDYERFAKHFSEIVGDPDYIIEANKPDTAVILKVVLCQEKVQVKCAQFPRSCRPGQPARAATDSAIVVRYSASY